MLQIQEHHSSIESSSAPRPRARLDNLTKAMAETGWFAAAMIHDIRNPLGTIVSASEVLLDVDASADRVRRLAGNMHDAALRMQELLTDLTNALQGNLAAPRVSGLREIVLAAWQKSQTSSDRTVRLLVEVPAELRLPLRRSCIERLFIDLFNNSLDAMRGGGGTIVVAARQTVGWVVVNVRDSGPGVPASIRERLFEPFVTEGKSCGMGLGLALAGETVRNHGGSIRLSAGGGAHFVITLPLRRSHSPGGRNSIIRQE